MQDLRTTTERRRKPDGIVKFVTIVSAIGWIMIIICSILIIYAKPEHTNMFYEMFNINIKDYWNYSLLNFVFILLTFLFALSLIGIMMNAMRQRRKIDRMNKSLIFQAIMSVIGMILLLINSII
jgi:xanthine/uracil/vitamin C permease (AzgA family)